MQLVIDIGNTRIKTAVYDEAAQVAHHTCDTDDDFRHTLRDITAAYAPTRAALSCVGPLTAEREDILRHISCPLLRLSGLTATPLTMDYATPETLGADRLAAAVGAYALYPARDLLIIDAGTCITYDYVSAGAHYLGGNISPGIEMRLDAMHEHTARLPRAKDGTPTRIGRTTTEALRNGARLGAALELQGYARQWLDDKTLQKPLILMADGENLLHELSAELQDGIIVRQDLVLNGLNAILIYQTDNMAGSLN